jgi:hypothetical protein
MGISGSSILRRRLRLAPLYAGGSFLRSQNLPLRSRLVRQATVSSAGVGGRAQHEAAPCPRVPVAFTQQYRRTWTRDLPIFPHL